jgi:catechol 2,3-dioxygenase-like lactoylglutathione lyase family enzyme
MTTKTRLCSFLILLAAAGRANPQAPALSNVCLITNNVKRLVDFYEPVLSLKAKMSGDDYAEFPTGTGVLAIFSAKAQENYIPGSAEAANNKGMILEFKVADVDREFRRLQSLVKIWVKPPTTQPWGTRSVYFRDPDGNLVNFYTPPNPTKPTP